MEQPNSEQLPPTKVAVEPVLSAFGFVQDPRDAARFRGPKGFDLTVRGGCFFDLRAREGGRGGVELIRHLRGCDSAYAVDLGKRLMAGERVLAAELRIRTPGPTLLRMPDPDTASMDQVRLILVGALGIDPAVIARLEEEKQLYASQRHIVAVMRNAAGDVIGGELIAHSAEAGAAGPVAPGTAKAMGAFSWVGAEPPSGRAVFVRNAIEAMAWASFYPRDHAISMCSGVQPGLLRWLVPRLLERGHQVCSALGTNAAALKASNWMTNTLGVKAISTDKLSPGAESVLQALRAARAAEQAKPQEANGPKLTPT